MEMEFKAAIGGKVLLRGMANGSQQVDSARGMEAIFKYGDVAYATECKITSLEDTQQ